MYDIRTIANIVGASLYGDASDSTIRHLAFDSRRVSFPAKTLFFALKGRRKDGHQFILDAWQHGVRHFVIQEDIDLSIYPGSVFLLVPDTLKALQKLVKHHRAKFEIPVIGITGSNGKTWVKEWLFQLLHRNYHIVRSPRSYNSQIGVPLSVWEIEREHTLGIFEAGISTTGEMEPLEEVIHPTIGVITMLGDAHAAGFENIAEKLREKANLFKRTQTIIYSKDQSIAADYIEKHFEDRCLLSWSSDRSDADLKLLKAIPGENGQHISYLYGNEEHQCFLPFRDHVSLKNALNCFLIAHHLGVSAGDIANRASEFQPIDMRLEIKEAADGCLLINDSYSFDISSLQLALELQQQYAKGRTKTVILSDMADQSDREAYARISALLEVHRPCRIIGIGRDIAAVSHRLDENQTFSLYNSTREFMVALPSLDFQNEVILLKGARAFGFERIVQELQARMHSAILEIDLNAMLHNLQYFAGKLVSGVRMMVMVKAAAYGSGSEEVARYLELQHVDLFAVAYPDEGIELRKAGIQAPILVLNPGRSALEKLIDYDLEPEVYTFSQLQTFEKIGEETGHKVNVHLKIDSGMHRLGFGRNDLEELIGMLSGLQHLHVASIFSHLAAADAPRHDTFTHQQAEAFISVYEKLTDALGYRPLRHILNSAGILRFPEYQFDMVRLGIGLYGAGMGKINTELVPVNTLTARISQIMELKEGDSVGYDRSFIAKRDMRVATVNIGYADGLLRKSGNGRHSMMLHGVPVPTIGNICMDMCMIDITQAGEVMEGDELEIFGKSKPVDDLAEACDTIAYEILSRISPRITRLYHMA